MPTLKEIIKGGMGPVTKGHYDWMGRPEHERILTPEALAFVQKVLSGDFEHDRHDRISPSGVGDECQRRILFGYAGAPKLPPPIENQDNMDTGSWLHLKWQTEGLSQGYLDQCEVWYHSEDYRMGGSLDGLGITAGIVDFKFNRGSVYNRVTANRCPKHEHAMQWEAYSLLSGVEHGSIVYVDRESGSFTEFLMTPDDQRRNELHQVLNDLHGWIDVEELPEMLYDCQRETGYTFRMCDYREHCPSAGNALRPAR